MCMGDEDKGAELGMGEEAKGAELGTVGPDFWPNLATLARNRG